MKTKSDLIRIITEYKDKILTLQNTYPKTNKTLIQMGYYEKQIKVYYECYPYSVEQLKDEYIYQHLSNMIETYLNTSEFSIYNHDSYVVKAYKYMKQIRYEKNIVCNILGWFLDEMYDRWIKQLTYGIYLMNELRDSKMKHKEFDGGGIKLIDSVTIKIGINSGR